MQAVIVSFDSLAANSLACYGNDWVETPNWDRLAATGAVFDRHFLPDTIGPTAGLAWTTGRQSLLPHASPATVSLGQRLKSSGVATRLVTASEQTAWQQRAEFDQTIVVHGREGLNAQPADVPFAQAVKAGLSEWNDVAFEQRPRLLWLHSSGPGIPPLGFDSLYFEDFEERGINLTEFSEEERSQHPAVYGGAVSLLDHWLGELLTGIETATEPTLIVMMAAQGYLWHQIPSFKTNESQIARPMLNDQRIRTPLTLNAFGDDRFAEMKSLRCNRLVQTVDLTATLLDWFGVIGATTDPSPAGQSWLRECTDDVPARSFLLIGDNDGNDAVRTEQWLCLRERRSTASTDSSVSNSADTCSLFAKPEDIWDINDIASQQPEVVSELLQHMPAQRLIRGD